jgi:hypothetical protein
MERVTVQNFALDSIDKDYGIVNKVLNQAADRSLDINDARLALIRLRENAQMYHLHPNTRSNDDE